MNKAGVTFKNQARRYDNDWLNVLATLVIFLFHCARFFDHEGWHVKNNQLDDGLTLFVGIVAQWIMPLFFLLSGISAYYSLRSRSGSRYLGNRLQRLVIPLVFGTLVVLIPVQVWIERVSHGQFEGSFLAFYPHYFEGLYAFGGNFAWMGLHLWYLEILFIFTLLTLPLFLVLKLAAIRAFIRRLAPFFARPGTIFLFGVPIFVVELLVNLQPDGLGIRAFGGWSLLTYLIVFITGFFITADAQYRLAMEKARFMSLSLGLATTSLMFLFPVDLAPLGTAIDYPVSILFRAFNSWFWLVTFLGFGSKYLNFSHDTLYYTRAAALPFYILHQTVIVVIGFYLVTWEMSVMSKYLILGTVSFVIIVALYELLVKRFNLLRFLFGMKVERSKPVVVRVGEQVASSR